MWLMSITILVLLSHLDIAMGSGDDVNALPGLFVF